jgi:hypothetical protein
VSDWRKMARQGQPGESEDNLGEKPFEASITKVDPETESLTADGTMGPSEMMIPHPLWGPNSWIRAIPERGARVVATTLASDQRRAALSYSTRFASEYISRYNDNKGLYKPLQEGEWDFMTPGLAYLYGQASGNLLLRGGPIQQALEVKRLRLRSRAPLFKRELHQNIDSEIGDEERFGVVVRHLKSDEKNRWIKVPLVGESSDTDHKGDAKTDSFAKEYLRKFGRDGTDLIELRQGDVIDDEGKPLKHTSTNKDLRHLFKAFNADASDSYTLEIDENSNVLLKTPATEVKYDARQATATVNLTKLVASITENMVFNVGASTTISSDASCEIKGSGGTKIGPGAVEPAVKGNQLVALILTPLLTSLGTLFNAGSQAASFSVYKSSLGIAGSAIQALAPLLIQTLSQNVKIGA